MNLWKFLSLLAITAACTTADAETVQLKWKNQQPESSGLPGSSYVGPIDLEINLTGPSVYPSQMTQADLTALTIGITTVGSNPDWAGRHYEYQVLPLFYNPGPEEIPHDWLCCSVSFYVELGPWGAGWGYVDIQAAIGNGDDRESVAFGRGPFTWETGDFEARYPLQGPPQITVVPEPGTWGLLLAGLFVTAWWARRSAQGRRKAAATNLLKLLPAVAIATASAAATADTVRLEWKDLQPVGLQQDPTLPSGPVDLALTMTGSNLYSTGTLRPSLLTEMSLAITQSDPAPGRTPYTHEFQLMPLYYLPSYPGGMPSAFLCCLLSFYGTLVDNTAEFAFLDISGSDGVSRLGGMSFDLNKSEFVWHGFFDSYHYAINGNPLVTAVPEPGTLGLLLAGLGVTCWLVRRSAGRERRAQVGDAAVMV